MHGICVCSSTRRVNFDGNNGLRHRIYSRARSSLRLSRRESKLHIRRLRAKPSPIFVRIKRCKMAREQSSSTLPPSIIRTTINASCTWPSMTWRAALCCPPVISNTNTNLYLCTVLYKRACELHLWSKF